MLDRAGFLASFVPKDVVTLLASGAALAVSFLGYRQRWHAGRMATRKQLTELLQRLLELNLQADTHHALRAAGEAKGYPPNYLQLLNDQRRFVVRQAEYLSRELPGMLSPYEYIVMAGAFASVEDAPQAERFYRRAVAESDDPIDRGIALRSHARFLFTRGAAEEARAEFRRALDAFAGDSDHMCFNRAHTYERWARVERQWGHAEARHELLQHAIGECSRAVNPARRAAEIDRIQRLTAAETSAAS